MQGVIQGSLWALALGGFGLGVASLAGEQPQFAQGPATPALAVPAAPVAVASLTPQSASRQLPADAMAPDMIAPEMIALAVRADQAPTIQQDQDVAISVLAQSVLMEDVLPDQAKTVELGAPSAPPQVQVANAPLIAPSAGVGLPQLDRQSPPSPVAPIRALTRAPAATPVPRIAVAGTVAPVADPSVTQPNLSAAALPALDIDGLPTAPQKPVGPAPVVVANAPPLPATPAPPIAVVRPAAAPQGATGTAAFRPVPTAPLVLIQGISGDGGTIQPSPPPAAGNVTVLRPATGDDTGLQSGIQALPQASNVQVNRPVADSAPAPDELATDDPQIEDDRTALERNAVAVPDAMVPARMAILLIDDRSIADAAAQLDSLDFVPTIALDATVPGTAELAESYRAGGAELALHARLPAGATPNDVEIAFEAARNVMPAMALVFSDGQGPVGDRALQAQLLSILAADGYGFVGQAQGLGDPARAAQEAGLRAAPVLSQIDGPNTDVTAIIRALDAGAFRARQSGEVVVLGRMTANTLIALQSWVSGLDRGTVDIVPVSAILLAQGDAG